MKESVCTIVDWLIGFLTAQAAQVPSSEASWFPSFVASWLRNSQTTWLAAFLSFTSMNFCKRRATDVRANQPLATVGANQRNRRWMWNNSWLNARSALRCEATQLAPRAHQPKSKSTLQVQISHRKTKSTATRANQQSRRASSASREEDVDQFRLQGQINRFKSKSTTTGSNQGIGE